MQKAKPKAARFGSRAHLSFVELTSAQIGQIGPRGPIVKIPVQASNPDKCRCALALQASGAPEEEDGGIDEEFHEGGGDDAADHGVAMRFMTSAPAPWLQRMAPGRNDDAGGHGLGANALDRAMIDGVAKVGAGSQAAILIQVSRARSR